jgi:hypothetical protein
MALFRSLAIFILVLAVMPWGAYSGALASQSRLQQTPGLAIADSDAAPVAVSIGGLRVGTFVAPKPKRCRTAVLIGSPCGPDIALPGSALSLDLTDADNAVLSAGGTQLTGVKPAGSLDPPRPC